MASIFSPTQNAAPKPAWRPGRAVLQDAAMEARASWGPGVVLERSGVGDLEHAAFPMDRHLRIRLEIDQRRSREPLSTTAARLGIRRRAHQTLRRSHSDGASYSPAERTRAGMLLDVLRE